MPKITYNEGETFILTSVFQGIPEAFGPFSVGLGSGPAPLNEATVLANLNEIVGTGYEASVIDRAAGASGWTLNGGAVTSPVLSFTNPSSTFTWPAVDFVFLSVVAAPSLVPNKLIAAVDLPNSVFVGPGQTFEVVFRFKLKDATYSGESPAQTPALAATSLEVAEAKVDGVDVPGFWS